MVSVVSVGVWSGAASGVACVLGASVLGAADVELLAVEVSDSVSGTVHSGAVPVRCAGVPSSRSCAPS